MLDRILNRTLVWYRLREAKRAMREHPEQRDATEALIRGVRENLEAHKRWVRARRDRTAPEGGALPDEDAAEDAAASRSIERALEGVLDDLQSEIEVARAGEARGRWRP